MSRPTRPGFHFTVPVGHINDPLGITWHDGRYEMFFQLNPEGVTWVPECRWGQVHAADLVRWGDSRTALRPGPGKGCWSGSVVLDEDGRPTIVYTLVDVTAPEIGQVALAQGDRSWDRWAPGAVPVLPGPPPELELGHFRDPAVTAEEGTGWRMVIGGGTRHGHAVALLYRSADLRHWRYDGVLAERSSTDVDPMPTGAVWECPQLVALSERWLLLLSRWDDGPLSVVVAVGDLHGSRFTARSWQSLDASGELYATTAFRDAAGRTCAVSWIPGAGPRGAPWAGMLSLPHVLSLDGDRLRVEPHPDVDSLRAEVLTDVAGLGGPFRLTAPADPLLDIELAVTATSAEGPVIAVGGPDGDVLRVVVDGEAAAIRVRRPDHEEVRLPLDPRSGAPVRLLLDAGLAEVFAGGAVAVLRLPRVDGRLHVSVVAGPAGVIERLVVHRLQRWFAAAG